MVQVYTVKKKKKGMFWTELHNSSWDTIYQHWKVYQCAYNRGPAGGIKD
jgi:hypothetical protein